MYIFIFRCCGVIGFNCFGKMGIIIKFNKKINVYFICRIFKEMFF